MQLQRQREILPLTGLRFFAAFFVVVSHLVSCRKDIPLVFSQLSGEGMTLFFLLSGFVIQYNYSASIQANPKRGIYKFFVARFARLVPLYLFCLVLDLALFYRHFPADKFSHLQVLPYYLTLTQSWFYKIVDHNQLIYQFGIVSQVAWSVSTEWFFYLCYPFICFYLTTVPKISSKLRCLFILTSLMFIGVLIFASNLDGVNAFATATYGPIASTLPDSQDSFFRWVIYFAPYTRISEFIAGCFLCALYLQLNEKPVTSREQRLGLWLALSALVMLGVLHWIMWGRPSQWWESLNNLHQCFGFVPPLAILIFCCARYQNFLTSFLSTRFLLWGGEISYSIYLFHPLFIAKAAHFLKKLSPIYFSLGGLVVMLIIMGFASLSYKLIEVPARQFLRNKLSFKKLSESSQTFSKEIL